MGLLSPMKNFAALSFILISVLLLSGCRKKEEDLGYNPDSTEFRFGYYNAAVDGQLFDPPRRIFISNSRGEYNESVDSLNLDKDSIVDLLIRVTKLVVPGELQSEGLGIESFFGLYAFQTGPILFDTVYQCKGPDSSFIYNRGSNYVCPANHQDSALKFNIVQQAISYQFGDAIIDADSDPNVGWDNRSLSLSSYSSGFDRNFNSHFRYENFIVPNRKKLYIAIENQLSGQLGWLHLQIIDHSEIQLYGYALQKLL